MADDPYKTLGVNRSASSDEIRKAYRDLARKYHPDLHPDDAAAKKKFQEVQAAFDVLNDPKKKEMFDRYGAGFDTSGRGPSGGPFGGGAWSGPGSGPGGQTFHFDLDDLFGGAAGPATERGGRGGSRGGGFADFFRQFGQTAPRPDAAARGADIEHELTVPFGTAINGGKAQVSVQRPNGKVENITATIPAGIEDGKKIRLRGQGEAGAGSAERGDLLITVRVSPHPYFTRRGKRLDVVVPITLDEAASGAKIDVPTPRGVVAVSVPPGTSSGKKLRIKGHGVAPKDEPPGDLFAEVQIVLPESLTGEERRTLAEISLRHPQNPRAELRW
jgi:DnaJ-class molecular chaperone